MAPRIHPAPLLSLTIGVLLLTACAPNIEGLRDDSGTVIHEGDENALAVSVGDCFTESDAVDSDADAKADANEPSTLPLVPCDAPHDSEVFYNHTLDGDDFPGVEQLNGIAQEVCATEFTSFIGRPFSDSELQLTFYTPSERTWTAGYDRIINCIVVDPASITGSLEHANR